eukprot:1847714-Ditylum_brightwellii.AAC.1
MEFSNCGGTDVAKDLVTSGTGEFGALVMMFLFLKGGKRRNILRPIAIKDVGLEQQEMMRILSI